MNITDFFRDGENTQQTQQVIKSRRIKTLVQISLRSQIGNWAVIALFFISLWATPIYRKFPNLAIQYGVALCLMCFGLFLLQGQIRRFKVKAIWAGLFVAMSLVYSLLWGLLSAWSIYQFNLSWTSFFITLVTLAIASTYSVVYSAYIKLFQGVLLLTIIPSIIVNTMMIKGQSGEAIGLFLIGFTGLLSFIGKRTNSNYWELTLSLQRLQGLIQAIPGTLCWLDSDFKFLGSNVKFNEILSVEGTIKEQKITKAHPLRPLAEQIFNGETSKSSSLEIAKKTFYFSGQKYNHKCEAVIIGMDITEQHMWQGMIEKERSIANEEGKLAELGRLLPVIVAYMNGTQQGTSSLNLIYYLGIDTKDDRRVTVGEVLSFIKELYSHYMQAHEISFKIDCDEGAGSKFPAKKIFVSLCILIQNSIEARSQTPEFGISIYSSSIDGDQIISVEDNGAGIPIEYEDVLFEPQISSKDQRTGVGLSLARDFISEMGGNINLTSPRQPTRFTITL